MTQAYVSPVKYFRNASNSFPKSYWSLAFSQSKSAVEILEGKHIYFVLASFIFLLVFIFHRRNKLSKKYDKTKHETNIQQRKEIKRTEDIPFISIFPFGFKMPIILEGLAVVFQFRREGINMLTRWRKTYGDIIQLGMLTDKVTFVSNPTLLQKILSCSDDRLLNKPRSLYDYLLTEWLRYGLISSEVEIWRPHRRILARCFTYNCLQSYLKTMNKHGKNLASLLKSQCSSDGSIRGQPMYDLVYFQAIKITSEFLMGVDANTEEESEAFHHNFKKWKTISVARLFQPYNLIPIIWKLNPSKWKSDRYAAAIKSYILKGVETCQKKIELEKETEDNSNITEVGSEINKDEHTTKPFQSAIEEMVRFNASPKEIYDEVGTFLTAGHEATILGMKLFLQHAAEHPHIQALCREEVDTLFESKVGSLGKDDTDIELTTEDLSNLKYLERCILETFRLTTLVPLIFREASEAVQLDEFRFEKGTIFCLGIWALHMDENFFPNPEKFDPDRFLPENVKTRHPFSFIPFSLGKRGCVGMKLAIMQTKVVLLWILRNFEIITTDKLQDIKMSFDVSIKPEREYNVIFKKR